MVSGCIRTTLVDIECQTTFLQSLEDLVESFIMLLLGFAIYQDIILRSKLCNGMHVCLHVNTYICADFMHMLVSVVECVCLCQV